MPNNEKKKLTPGYWIALGIVALAVILGVVGFVLMQTQRHEPDQETSPPTSTEPTTATEAPKPATGACDVPGGNITTVPADIRWEAVEGISWPVSDSLGPASVKDGFAVCFSRSPVGAALAATTEFFAMAKYGPAEAAQFYVVDSPGKAVALSQTGGKTAAGTRAQFRDAGFSVVGFRVDEYTENRALVRVVMQAPNTATGFIGRAITVDWVDGDWRWKLQDTGSTGDVVPVNSGQFTRWSDDG